MNLIITIVILIPFLAACEERTKPRVAENEQDSNDGYDDDATKDSGDGNLIDEDASEEENNDNFWKNNGICDRDSIWDEDCINSSERNFLRVFASNHSQNYEKEDLKYMITYSINNITYEDRHDEEIYQSSLFVSFVFTDHNNNNYEMTLWVSCFEDYYYPRDLMWGETYTEPRSLFLPGTNWGIIPNVCWGHIARNGEDGVLTYAKSGYLTLRMWDLFKGKKKNDPILIWFAGDFDFEVGPGITEINRLKGQFNVLVPRYYGKGEPGGLPLPEAPSED